MPDIGVAAAAELGVELDRLALIPNPEAEVAAVLSALIDGFGLVVLGPAIARGMRASLARRLDGFATEVRYCSPPARGRAPTSR